MAGVVSRGIERGGAGGGPLPPIKSGQGAKRGHIFSLIWPIRY